jgi:hypothetical protein
VKRYAVLYLATLVVIIPIDFLFLGIIAKGFFTSQARTDHRQLDRSKALTSLRGALATKQSSPRAQLSGLLRLGSQ